MRFAVIGAGNTGKAVTAYLKKEGQEVVLYCRNAQLAQQLCQGLTAQGAVEGKFEVKATSDLAEAVRGAQVILVQTVASGHAPVAQALKGLLEPGQIILIFNGNWGAAEFAAILGQEAKEKGVAICETGAQLFLCASPSPVSVDVKTIKQGIALACTEASRTGEVIETLKEAFPQLTAGKNVVDTSLNGSNPVVHGPIATFNITRLENGEDYTLFGTALPQKTVEYIEHIDAERCAVAQAVGVEGISVLDILNSFWPDKKTSVYGALKENKAYEATPGPKSLKHRYLDEDLPYGLVPLVRLGDIYGVDTPYLDALIRVLGMYLGRDYLKEGPAVENFNFKELLG